MFAGFIIMFLSTLSKSKDFFFEQKLPYVAGGGRKDGTDCSIFLVFLYYILVIVTKDYIVL